MGVFQHPKNPKLTEGTQGHLATWRVGHGAKSGPDRGHAGSPPRASSAPFRGLRTRATSAYGSEAVLKEPRRKGKVFQVRGKWGEGGGREEREGSQEPAVVPDKGSSDQAQGTIVILCPNVLSL